MRFYMILAIALALSAVAFIGATEARAYEPYPDSGVYKFEIYYDCVFLDSRTQKISSTRQTIWFYDREFEAGKKALAWFQEYHTRILYQVYPDRYVYNRCTVSEYQILPPVPGLDPVNVTAK